MQDDSRDWRRNDVGRRFAISLERLEGRGIAFAGRVFGEGFGV